MSQTTTQNWDIHNEAESSTAAPWQLTQSEKIKVADATEIEPAPPACKDCSLEESTTYTVCDEVIRSATSSDFVNLLRLADTR
jgi:hypothetical protein